jgi:hypothetical protein
VDITNGLPTAFMIFYDRAIFNIHMWFYPMAKEKDKMGDGVMMAGGPLDNIVFLELLKANPELKKYELGLSGRPKDMLVVATKGQEMKAYVGPLKLASYLAGIREDHILEVIEVLAATSRLKESGVRVETDARWGRYYHDFSIRADKKIFAIETKFYTNPVPAQVIYDLAGRSENLDGLAVISSGGFTSDAIKAARRHNIRLVTADRVNQFIDELKRGKLLIGPAVVPTSVVSSIEFFTGNFKRALSKVKSATTNDEKKKSLEDLAEVLIMPISGLAVLRHNLRSSAEEIDVLVTNESKDIFWIRLDSPILIECKHWSTPVGVTEIGDVVRKLNSLGKPTSILLTLNGITGNDFRDARLLLRELRQKEQYIIVLNESDLVEIAAGVDPSDKIKEKYHEIFTI